jgi:hypothetical protein
MCDVGSAAHNARLREHRKKEQGDVRRPALIVRTRPDSSYFFFFSTVIVTVAVVESGLIGMTPFGGGHVRSSLAL